MEKATKAYTMIRSGDNKTAHLDYFYSCKRVAQILGGQWVVKNNTNGKQCLITADKHFFMIDRWK